LEVKTFLEFEMSKETTVWGLIFYLSMSVTVFGAEGENYPPRLRRSESFLGVHFDFHAGDDCTEIGKGVDREMVEYIIEKVKPDYVQCDCKGHAGRSSYPTKAGNPAPGFVKDPLKIWRQVTAEKGVALYLHYSGVWDSKAVEVHPEWARINEKGERDKRLTSVYGPYVDKLLIPQLKELSDEYGVDGVWVDGECWATEREYADPVIKAFQKQVGTKEVPRKPGDPYWFEFSEFCRDGFRSYLNHYVTVMHEHNPKFQIASNWMYSSMVPEPVTINVDYISGDFSPMDSVNTARFEGRSMVHQGKPWDLMSWSFTRTDGLYSTKTVPQLKQEAAIVLALGGGFQAYFPQRRDGSVRKWQMELMGQVAEFCRARQQICHKAKPFPQVGLIYSGKAFYRKARKLFAAYGGEVVPLRGVLQSLLESQNVVDIVMEHHLDGRMQEYPLLIYPEWDTIDPAFRKELLDYVYQGGNLLIVGPRAAALFEKELGVVLHGKATEKVNGLEYDGWVTGIKSLFQKAELSERAKSVGKVHTDNDVDSPSEPAASITNYGKGKLAATYLNLGERYRNGATSVSREFLQALVRELMPDPLVTVSGSHHMDVSANRKDGKLAINLVNTAGPHGNGKVFVFDDIPAVGPLSVAIRHGRKPNQVTLEPHGRRIDYIYREGKIHVTVPRLAIHEIIVVE
jgi:hypothetical protein